jgi:hypothetical protein
MSEVLTRKTLRKMGCADPSCTADHSVLYFHSLCCEDKRGNEAPLQARYEKATGVLTLECVGCGNAVGAFQIAENAQTALELN